MKDLDDKLQGVEEIISFFRWSKSKYFRMRQELIQASILYYEYHGRPPRKTPCLMKESGAIWLSIKAGKNQIV